MSIYHDPTISELDTFAVVRAILATQPPQRLWAIADPKQDASTLDRAGWFVELCLLIPRLDACRRAFGTKAALQVRGDAQLLLVARCALPYIPAFDD